MKKQTLISLLNFMVKKGIAKEDNGDYDLGKGNIIKWEMIQYDKFNAIEKVIKNL